MKTSLWQTACEDAVDRPAMPITPESIATAVDRAAACFGVTRDQILRTRSRSEPLATARKVAMVLVYDILLSVPATARIFGRHRRAVSNALAHTDPDYIHACIAGRRVSLLPAKLPARASQHLCLCGRIAIAHRHGDYVCARCAAIESRLSQFHPGSAR